MTLSGCGPGKTAPKLQHDFLLFDPLHANTHSNILTDFTPPVGEGAQLAPLPGACKHDYTTKSEQSITPPLDLRPDGGTQYKVAVICKKCRLHAHILIGFTYARNSCPNSDYPLHHFQRAPPADFIGQDRISNTWKCSSPECGAILTIMYRLPRLQSVRDLTDTELLKRRYESVLKDDPNREGVRQATPIEALGRLRRYIQDSLNTEHERRAFPANNKRFMEAFGVHGRDCATLLEFLGFTYVTGGDVEIPQWTLPQPPLVDDRLNSDGSSLREMLEDVRYELLAFMAKTASETNSVNPAAGEGWPSANRDVERTLAAQGYVRHVSLRRTTASVEELPYYASLGSLHDFADPLIEFAFDRQLFCDPERRAYYFECLQVITEHRNTERLQMKVATLASQDLISRRDLSNAYRTLNISVPESRSADDERILNLFQVLLSDSGASAQENARQALYKIGAARGSRRLMNASRQTMESYEDALTWIGNGVTRDTTDESLLAVVSMRTGESKDNEELAQKAVSIIARERKSSFLNQWLLTGRSDGYQMTPDEALRHLGVDAAFSAVDIEMLATLFESARVDRPGEQTERAIATLQQAAAGSNSTTHSHSPETWPVGLTSHGNTCYLNSLLQYYFSIAPLRSIVLNYDQYKLDTTKYEEKTERVGQRKISMVEIKGGQRFAEDLKQLFDRMIKEPREHIKPEEDLVCRAFLEPKDYALLATAVMEEKTTQLAQINGSLENAIAEKITEDTPTTGGEDVRHPSDASSATLQASISGDEDAIMKDGDPPLTPPASPGLEAAKQGKPVTAPPLPPRRFSVSKQEALKKAQDNAKQQQDVTEVHDSIMFRLRSGMMPLGKDATEEQEDALRDLFKIALAETTVKDGEDGKQKELLDSSIQLNVPTDHTNIYSALDAVFDLQGYGDTSGTSFFETYKTIRNLPPLLQINIPRIGFDKDSRGGAFKSDKCVKLEDELYLDRYTDAADPNILTKRKSCWGWRKQLHALRKEQSALTETAIGLDGPSAVVETAKYLSNFPEINNELDSLGIDGIDVAPELPITLNADATVLNARLDALKTQIDHLESKLKDQFVDAKKLKYRLAAVFFHRGNQGHGHYWIYIRDFAKNIWRSYNDERVEEFSKVNEILEANTWQHGTPTYAVYVQADQVSNVIQPVCRSPEPLPAAEGSEHAPSPWVEVAMEDSADQPSSLAVDPKLTVNEGGASAWDEKRQVPQVSW